MTPELPASALIPSPGSLSEPVSKRPAAPRWRWWLALVLMGGSPLLISFLALSRKMSGAERGAMLPANWSQLLYFCTLQLGVFAVLWAVTWALSRANREQLFFRPLGAKGMLKSVAGGFGYSLLMRLLIVFVTILVFLWLTLIGFDIKQITKTLQSGAEAIKTAFSPAFAGHDSLYKISLVVLLSFVVAGLREELWRAATLAGMRHLAPATWTEGRKNGVSLAVSSVIFGLAHLYQGAVGIVTTGILGVALGAIMLRHKSLWPAVFAHGFFDALSFGLLAWQSVRK